jgi:hypothetical protein
VSVLPRLVGVGGQGLVGVEVFIALDGESERAAQRAELGHADVAEFRAAHPEVAQSEGDVIES